MASRSATARLLHAVILLFVLTTIYHLLPWFKSRHHTQVPVASHLQEVPVPKTISKRLVVASRKSDDTTWIGRRLPDWPVSRYIVDDPNAELTVPVNKGRESMVYLTSVPSLTLLSTIIAEKRS